MGVEFWIVVVWVFFAFGGGIFLVLASWAFSCLLIGLLVFPLCGGHLLFFAHQVDFLRGAAAKKSKRKRLKNR